MIPITKVFRVRFRPCSDGRPSTVSFFDTSSGAITIIEHSNDALSENMAVSHLRKMGHEVTGKFEYKGDLFLITQ